MDSAAMESYRSGIGLRVASLVSKYIGLGGRKPWEMPAGVSPSLDRPVTLLDFLLYLVV